MPKKMDLIQLDVKVVDKIYLGNDGFGIYEMELLNATKEGDLDFVEKRDTITVQGNFDRRFFADEEFFMYGTVFEHKSYGRQYKIQLVEHKFDTPDRIRAFLLTMVAPSICDQLIDKYGGAVLDKIVNNEVDYTDIHGMGEVRFNSLREKVVENKYMKDMIMSLSQYGITPLQMQNIAREFGANAVSKIQENPYVLCRVRGIGFEKADSIASKMGFDKDSPYRIREAFKYVIEQEQLSGNAWISTRKLFSETYSLLGIHDKKKIISELPETDGVVIIEDKVTLQRTYEAERNISEKLLEIQLNPVPLPFPSGNWEEYVANFIKNQEEKRDITLTDEQKSFFYNFSMNRVNFLVGYAGCGKSALQVMLLDFLEGMWLTAILLAPTGKAAKVLEEYTGRKAYTMHRALKVMDMQNQEVNKIFEDVILVDESSMADVYITSKLMDSLENKSVRLVFIGDDFQIPSVGVGNFLHDMINANVFPVTKLTKVFRQAEGGLLDVVTKIRLNQRFLEDAFEGIRKFGNDLLIHACPQQFMADGYKHYYKKALTKFDVEDIVILTPTKKGLLGTLAINNEIQEIVNPASPHKREIKHGMYQIFREGDRIINKKNTYKVMTTDFKEVDIVNGDMGYIEEIDTINNWIIVDYGFATVKVPFKNIENLDHCWAMTIHKSQGSGFKCVIMVMDKAHKFQLNANIVYTGLTRAKTCAFALLQSDVMNLSMKKNVSLQRNTFMPHLLQELTA